MKRFIQGNNRNQGTLFPEYLEDYVYENNPVRIVDAFVEQLNLGKLGFDRAEPAVTGRPSYHPSVLLKLYIYGYLNRIQSSRRLERETQRNVGLMWLLDRLTPDFKTIANFRKDNGKAICKVCSQFVVLCRQLNLLTEATVAVDGSKFKAVNNIGRNFSVHKLARQRERIEASINRYLADLGKADLQRADNVQSKTERLQDKIAQLKERMAQLDQIEIQLQESPDKQLSLTDPDARSMMTSGRGKRVVGYNVQVAVDTEHHLIVVHEVTNVGHDRSQLANMASQAKAALATAKLKVLADRGYFSSEEIRQCHEAGITAFVPKCLTSGAKAAGRFDKADFKYHPEADEYICPAGQRLIWRFARIEGGLKLSRYWSSHCPQCEIKAKCTPGANRRVSRWEHQGILDEMQNRLDSNPDIMRLRSQTVEHSFGTLKAWMGATHFLTKTLKNVSTEMSLHVLAYNLKRVMNIIGNKELMEAMVAV
jgi:transposase